MANEGSQRLVKPSDYSEVIFRTEQRMLPKEERVCTVCKGSGVRFFSYKEWMQYAKSLSESFEHCEECGGTGKWLRQCEISAKRDMEAQELRNQRFGDYFNPRPMITRK